MSRLPRLTALALSSLLIVTLARTPVRADLITVVTPTVLSEPGGLFLFSYSVANSSASTVGVAEFDVTVSAGATLTSITQPTGFLALYTPGDSFISYLSSDPSTDIAPGLAGSFSFVGNLPPISVPDLTRGYDASGNAFSSAGTTLAPAGVPEPSAWILCVAAGLSFTSVRAGRNLLSKRRSAVSPRK